MHHDGIRRVLTTAAATAVVAVSVQARAYCRTTTCDPNTEDCSPAAGQTCTTKGLPLYWPVRCTSYDLEKASTDGIAYEAFSAVAAASFGAWLQADCGSGQKPLIEIQDLGPIPEAHACYNQNAGNTNAVFFQTKAWPYANAANTLALTTVTYNVQTGEIYDVDMEINATLGMDITVGDLNVGNDLQSIMTHEAGHFYGLAHTPSDSMGSCAETMCAKYKEGTTGLRNLTADDQAGMCAVYPPTRNVGPLCDATPRHGFGYTCDPGQPPKKSGCSVTAPGAGAGGVWGVVLAAIGVMVIRRRRGLG